MESDGTAPMLTPQANDGVDFAFASQQIIAASAQMFAAPQQNFQKTLVGLLGMIEEQQKQIKRLQGETHSLKDEMGEIAPRLDGLDNQVKFRPNCSLLPRFPLNTSDCTGRQNCRAGENTGVQSLG